MALPWTILDHVELCSAYLTGTGLDEQTAVQSLFATQKIIGKAKCESAISCSLFCKYVDTETTGVTPTRSNANEVLSRAGNAKWWDFYVAPLLHKLHAIAYQHPSMDVHLYLGSDLEWMVDALALPQVVIHLMESSSISAQPGMMWRFLTHDISGLSEVFIMDIEDNWCRTLSSKTIPLWRESGLVLLRYINPHEFANAEEICIYRPICANFFAIRPQSQFSMRTACEAFVSLAKAGAAPLDINHPVRGSCPAFGHTWPYYGFDETFLQRVFYPFTQTVGVFTVIDEVKSPYLFPADMESTFNAHPASVLSIGF